MACKAEKCGTLSEKSSCSGGKKDFIIMITVIIILSGGCAVYVCLCKGISESQVRACGRRGICSADALALALGLEEEGVCGRCIRNIDALVALATSDLAGITEGERAIA
jgi:bacterioferritin-associated ferredoxin